MSANGYHPQCSHRESLAEAKENKRLREENKRLKHAVADLTLDNQILKETASGNF